MNARIHKVFEELAAISQRGTETTTEAQVEALREQAIRLIKLLGQLPAIGLRVEVFDGTGKVPIGRGTLVDFVTVYVKRTEEGGLTSKRFAEEPFEGAFSIENNPKILMDDGTVRYGCQVWWGVVAEEQGKAS